MMTYGIRLHVWGDYACFTRPEMKVERVSYDVMTPSAARGILEAVHWKPAIRWILDRIHVLKPLQFQSIRRNELASKIPASAAKTAMNTGNLAKLHQSIEDDRQQRATLALYQPAYVIEAHFELTDKAGADDTEGKHLDIFNRRAAKGQCFHRPCLGCREFAAYFESVTDIPASTLDKADRNKDLGWMLYDINFEDGNTPVFFRARLIDGILDVKSLKPEEFVS
jgi:CRISPR-associated protein Cas5d